MSVMSCQFSATHTIHYDGLTCPCCSLSGGYNLRVENLQRRDEGQYTCSVSTLGSPVTLTHQLEILGKYFSVTPNIFVSTIVSRLLWLGLRCFPPAEETILM